MRVPLKNMLPILLICILFSAAAITNNRLHLARIPSGQQAIMSTGTLRSSPPGVAIITVFLGGFRGLIADWLWVRAIDLQEKGRYFELVQLSDWITALEPQFTEVWALQAWNMAYNISILMPDDDNRWRWVQNGISLLRDKALVANPFNPNLCFELGLLFQQKIGGNSDEYSDAYKIRWAKQIMQTITPNGLPNYSLLALDSPQRRAIEEELRMDPDMMQQIEVRYGALDWRVAESHAVYWAYTGIQENPNAGAANQCRRMIYQSMATLFEAGALTCDPHAGIFVYAPAFDLLPGVILAYEDAMDSDPTAHDAYEMFLSRAVSLLAFYNRTCDAKTWFEKLHTRFPSKATQAGFEAFTRTVRPVIPKIITEKHTP